MPPQIRLIVEGTVEHDIVFTLLLRAGLPLENLDIRVNDSIATVRKNHKLGRIDAALVDVEDRNPNEVRKELEEQLGIGRVFCAVPNIEAWLTADEETARELIDYGSRLPVFQATRPSETGRDEGVLLTLASCLQIERAAARMPSLREFLVGVSELLGVGDTRRFEETAGRSLSREMLAGLVREVPPSELAWRTSNGTTFTSRELVAEIEAGTELGRQYASDLLRVSRDFLRRKAKRSA